MDNSKFNCERCIHIDKPVIRAPCKECFEESDGISWTYPKFESYPIPIEELR